MKRMLALFVATSALSVSAQTLAPLAIRLASDSTSDLYTFSQGQCRDSVRLTWIYNALGTYQLCTDMKIWATEAECGDAPQTADTIYDPISRAIMLTTKQGTFDVSLESLPGLKDGSSSPCGTADIQKTHKICGVVETAITCGFTAQQKTTASPMKIIYDAKKPDPPEITDIEARDSSLRVTFTVGTDAAEIQSAVRPQGTETYVDNEVVAASAQFLTLSKLENGTTYDVILRAKDLAGNVSAESNVMSATPIATVGFWGTYRNLGGREPGGCSAATGAGVSVALWASLGVLRSIRRRHTR